MTLAVVLVAVAPTGTAAIAFAVTAAVATLMTTVTVAATTVAVSATIAAAIATRLLILVTLGFREQSTVRQPVLASLFVDFDKLHLDLVTHAEHLVHVLNAAVGDLRHVQQTVGVGQELHKCAEVGDGLDRAFVNLTHLRQCGDEFDTRHGGVDVIHVGSCDVNDTEFADLFDVLAR